MRILIADDDATGRKLLQLCLERWGHRVTVAKNGAEALDLLSAPNAPRMAILDWIMPELSGPEVCGILRRRTERGLFYGILLTVKDRSRDIAAGLKAGADDYLVKPFDHDELRGRLHVGMRTLHLQAKLAHRIHTRPIDLPICCFCKRLQPEEDSWQDVDDYIRENSDVRLKSELCPECSKMFDHPGRRSAFGDGAAFTTESPLGESR